MEGFLLLGANWTAVSTDYGFYGNGRCVWVKLQVALTGWRGGINEWFTPRTHHTWQNFACCFLDAVAGVYVCVCMSCVSWMKSTSWLWLYVVVESCIRSWVVHLLYMLCVCVAVSSFKLLLLSLSLSLSLSSRDEWGRTRIEGKCSSGSCPRSSGK